MSKIDEKEPQPSSERCEHEWVMQMGLAINSGFAYEKPGPTTCKKCGSFKGTVIGTMTFGSTQGEPREPHAALVKEIDATLDMVNEGGRGHCSLCEHPPVTGEVAENQHYSDCLFFTLRRCKAAILGGQG